MLKSFLFGLVALLPCYGIAQCMMVPVSMEQKCNNSQLIAEGEIISATPIWNENKTGIYTLYAIKVYKYFKSGNIEDKTIELVIQGGQLDNELHTVSHNPKLTSGLQGIFFLNSCNPQNEYGVNVFDAKNYITPPNTFKLYAAAQGLIKYNLNSNDASCPFNTYQNVGDLYDILIQEIGKSYTIINKLPNKNTYFSKIINATITSLNPDTVTAGTDETLTINGSGFGSSYTGSAAIEFKSPDDGGASFFLIPSDHIVSWSDSEVKVIVPGNYSSGSAPGAGTGSVRVTNSSGNSSTSSTDLTVLYNHTGIEYSGAYYPPDLVNENNSGGYTYKFNNSFKSNSDAVGAFMRALETWQCGSYMNFDTSGTTSLDCNSDDGENIITFDNNCALPVGVLGTSFSFYSGCAGIDINWYLSGNDIVFSADLSPYSWNYSELMPSSSQYDFQSVSAHELGHSHQLGHIIADGKVMHYALTNGTETRTLNALHDVDGGKAIMDRSLITNSCGPGEMIPFDSTICSTADNPPVAGFKLDNYNGCLPFTINYSDTSSNSPQYWNWDFDNDGTFDSQNENGTYTYTSAGLYGIKLIVTNSDGSDSIIKSNLVTVYGLPDSTVSVSSDSICYGDTINMSVNSGNQFSWSPAISLDDSIEKNVKAFPDTLTIYKVIITDSNACTSTGTKVIYVFQPTANFIADTTYLSNINDSIGFTNLSSNSTSWNWDFGDGSTGILENPVHIYNSADTFSVSLLVNDIIGCTDSMVKTNYIIVDMSVNIDYKILDDEISVFPNPAFNSYSFEFPENVDVAEINIALYDELGKVVEVEKEYFGNLIRIKSMVSLSDNCYMYQIILKNKLIQSGKLLVLPQ